MKSTKLSQSVAIAATLTTDWYWQNHSYKNAKTHKTPIKIKLGFNFVNTRTKYKETKIMILRKLVNSNKTQQNKNINNKISTKQSQIRK